MAGRRQAVLLVTVVRRPAAPWRRLRSARMGQAVGSVSAGASTIVGARAARARTSPTQAATYGVTADARAPGGGTIQLVLEPMTSDSKIVELLGISRGAHRMLVIGAGQLSKYLAQIAVGLDYQVTVCDPREEYTETWDVPGVSLVKTMPDDTVVDMKLDERCAVVALTHDPKLDDMALLEALKSRAFYVGALGSRANNVKRRQRLEEFDLTPEQIARLHGPIGLYIGSRTPPEIAISILAEITANKNGVPLPDVAQVAIAKEKLDPSVACETSDS
jgi:xanthine/CO dehydrogenase XdhC/CoxF family maturation factor